MITNCENCERSVKLYAGLCPPCLHVRYDLLVTLLGHAQISHEWLLTSIQWVADKNGANYSQELKHAVAVFEAIELAQG